MKYTPLRFILITGFAIISMSLFAQQGEIEIKGKVLESNSGQPIEFASVLVADKTTQLPITGRHHGYRRQFQRTDEYAQFLHRGQLPWLRYENDQGHPRRRRHGRPGHDYPLRK